MQKLFMISSVRQQMSWYKHISPLHTEQHLVKGIFKCTCF